MSEEYIDIPKTAVGEEHRSPARFRVVRLSRTIRFVREVSVDGGPWQESWLGGHIYIPNELKQALASALLKER